MNTYTVTLLDKVYNTTVTKKETSIAAFRYCKMFLTKHYKLNLYDYFKEKTLLESCPFCGNDSSYIFSYEIKEMNIIVYGLKLRECHDMKDYHCHLGKNVCPGSKLNPNSVEYISTSFKIDQESALNFIHSRNKTKFYRENHESEETYKKYQTHDIEWFITKYGEENGLLKFNKMKLMCSIKNTNDYVKKTYGEDVLQELSKKKAVGLISWWIAKYGEENGRTLYDNWKNSCKNTEKTFITRYGASGSEKFEKYKERKRTYYTLENFINIYGKIEGTYKWKEFIHKSTFTRKQYIEKYGEERWVESRTRSANVFYSKESIAAFEMLLTEFKKCEISVHSIKWKEEEFFLYDKEYQRIYFYDLFFKIGDKSYIVEYDTPFMHPNKDFLDDTQFESWKSPFSNISPEEKMKYDIRKREIAINKGIDVITFYSKSQIDIHDNIDKIIRYVNK